MRRESSLRFDSLFYHLALFRNRHKTNASGLFFFFKNKLILLLVVYVGGRWGTPMSVGALRRQSWWISSETQFQVAMGHLMWVLGTEHKPLQGPCTVLVTEPSLQTRLLALLFLPQLPGFLSSSYLQPHQTVWQGLSQWPASFCN